MIVKENLALLDNYDASTDLGPNYNAAGLSVQVFNNSATFLLYKQATDKTQSAEPQGEFTTTPGSFTVPGGIGLRAKNAVAGSTARIFAQLYEKADVQAFGFVPTSQTIAASGALTTVGVIDHSVSVVDVANTLVETTIYSFPLTAGQLAATGMLRCALIGDGLNNNANGQTTTLRLKLGGVTLAAAVLNMGGAQPTRAGFKVDAYIGNQSALTQWGLLSVLYGDNTQTNAKVDAVGSGAGGIDTTAATTFAITVQHPAASVNLSLRKEYVLLESL